MIGWEEALETVAQNLRFIGDRQSVAQPLLDSQLAEIARVMASVTDERSDWDEKRQIWHDTLQKLPVTAQRSALARQYHLALSARYRVEILPRSMSEIESICYLRNRGSDGAFDRMTAHLPNVRAVYAAGHEEALEHCYDEYSDACILPYSDPERGMHMGFRTMIARYGLKITSLVRVENRDGVAMDYVLLRRDAALTDPRQAQLAVTLPVHESGVLAEALSAAVDCELAVQDVTKLPEQFSSTPSYDLHFTGTGKAIEAYLFYLALNHPRFDLLGVYQKEREMI